MFSDSQISPQKPSPMIMGRRIYADYAASAPLRPEAWEVMTRTQHLLNPGAQHGSGRQAWKVVEESREKIADLLGCDRVEVIFTGSGTEADNIAIHGLAWGSYHARGAQRILSSDIEHPAVKKPIEWLTQGLSDLLSTSPFEHQTLRVTETGHCSLPPELESGRDALVTLMWVNNETGAIQPVGHYAEKTQKAGVPFHIDAVQMMGQRKINFHSLGATSLAGSAHKFGGPKSMGILLVSRDAVMKTPFVGGGQERGLRPGTVNPQAAAATAAALEAALKESEAKERAQQEYQTMIREVVAGIDNALINTHEPALPHFMNISFPGAESDSLLMLLDAAGVDCSSGSACSAGVNRASEVLLTMGVPEKIARGTLRFSFGSMTTEEDIRRICTLLPQVVSQARSAGMA